MSELKKGDCLELLSELKDGSIDLLITDPPYAIGTTSNGTKGSWSDNNLIRPFFEKYFEEIKRVLKNGAEFYINTDWRTYPFLYPIVTTKLDVRNCIVWDYEWIKAGSHYRFSHEFIIYGFKGENKRTFDASSRDVWRIKPINFTSKNKWHQAEKPIELVKTMILNSSKEGDIILDTFAGSGTTGVACYETKRQFIGFEIDDDTYKKAIKRVKAATAQTFLF
ncbi:DNA adenine methyltransferase YhdJ [anaerobic digester metagenome]